VGGLAGQKAHRRIAGDFFGLLVLVFFCLFVCFKIRSHYIAQAGLELLGSNHPSCSAFQQTGIQAHRSLLSPGEWGYCSIRREKLPWVFQRQCSLILFISGYFQEKVSVPTSKSLSARP
jgi:hypothetical protein